MKVHYLQHVFYEDLGCIENWVKENNYSLSSTKFFLNEKLPPVNNLDFLIIMGGPMNINDEVQYPWLKEEKEFIKNSIKKNKKILGICLGSQLIAASLGKNIYRNKYKEVGWFPVKITNKQILFEGFPSEVKVFHWHEDTFDLPDGAINLAESEGCKNQAYAVNKNIAGLQFHFEVTKESLGNMIKHGMNDPEVSKYVQPKETLLQNENFIECNNLMFKLLDKIAG